MASMKSMPGAESGIAVLDAPAWSQKTIRTYPITRYHMVSLEDLVPHLSHPFHAAWLDFNGQLTDKRIESIARLWDGFISETLVVTALNGRVAGGGKDKLENALAHPSGSTIRYRDGAPMIQMTFNKG